MLEDPTGACSLGVVHDSVAGIVAAASLDCERRSLIAKTFPLSSLGLDELGLFRGDGPPESCDDPEVQELSQTMYQLCRGKVPMAVLIAVPAVLPDPDFPQGQQPPLAIFEPSSALLKVMFVVATSGYASCLSTVINHDDLHSRIAVRQVPEAQRAEHRLPRSTLYLNHDLLMACTALLTDGGASLPRAAAMAALIAAWPSSYSYWSSFGRMFSSVDIVCALRAGQTRTYLGADSEFVGVRWNSRRKAEIVDEVAMEHALAMQKHTHLHEHDALKVALVAVAKTLGITVTCRSKRIDAMQSKYTEVWPPREPHLWAMDLVRQQP